MVYAYDSKSYGVTRVGSSPTLGTDIYRKYFGYG